MIIALPSFSEVVMAKAKHRSSEGRKVKMRSMLCPTGAEKNPAERGQNWVGPILTKAGRWRKSLTSLPPYCQGSCVSSRTEHPRSPLLPLTNIRSPLTYARILHQAILPLSLILTPRCPHLSAYQPIKRTISPRPRPSLNSWTNLAYAMLSSEDSRGPC